MQQQVPKELRARVDRLMSGKTMEVDANEIFIWLRDHASQPGFEIVRDIGDFCAHRHERDKGFSWSLGKYFFDIVLFEIMQFNYSAHESSDLSLLKTSLNARANFSTDRDITKLFSMERNKFIELSGNSINLVVGMENGHPILDKLATEQNRSIIKYLCRYKETPKPILQPEFLWETYNLMCKCNLITRKNARDFMKISEYLCVFAMSRMHLTKFRIASSTCYLTMAVSTTMVNRLIVRLFVKPEGRYVPCTTIFQSSCDARKWSSREFHANVLWPGIIHDASSGTPVDFSSGILRSFDHKECSEQQEGILNTLREPILYLKPWDPNGPRPSHI